MPAYHSAFNSDQGLKLSTLPLLPFKTKTKGPAPPQSTLSLTPVDLTQDDIIDEALALYRANTFFRNFDIKGGADKLLIYLTLYIQECLAKLLKAPNPTEAMKLLQTHAVQSFALPGEGSFPLNSMFEKPANRMEAGIPRVYVDSLKAYLTQIRQETSIRLVERVYEPGTRLLMQGMNEPSKWWMCFAKRKFMGINGVGTFQ